MVFCLVLLAWWVLFLLAEHFVADACKRAAVRRARARARARAHLMAQVSEEILATVPGYHVDVLPWGLAAAHTLSAKVS
jgi:hypothetical protein